MISAVNGTNSFILKRGLWVLVAALFVFIAASFVVERKPLYFLVFSAPLVVYLLIHKTIVFPVGFYLVLLPFDSLLAMSSSGQGATITRLMGIITIAVLSLKGMHEKKLKLKNIETAAIWMILFILYSITSSLWAVNPENTLLGIQTVIGLLILYLVIIAYQIKKQDFEYLKLCVMLGGLAAAVMTSYYFFTGNFSLNLGNRATLYMEDRGAVNPNELAYCFLFPLSISIETLLSGRGGKISKMLYFCAFIILVFSIVVTGSRKNMLAIGAILLTYMFFLKEKKGLALAIFIAVAAVVLPLTSSIVFDRWDAAAATGGDGRIGLWTVGIHSLEKYWLFGAGLFNFPNVYTEFANYNPGYMGLYRASHNTFLEVIVELGIVGLLLMAVMLWKHYSAVAPSNMGKDGNHVMLKAVFWAMITSNCFGDFFFTEKAFWALLMLMIVYKNILKTEMRERVFQPAAATHFFRRSNRMDGD